MPTYHVLNEHTLGYVYAEQPGRLNILRASILRGSPHGNFDGPIALSPLDTLRAATPADFDLYRVVSPKGLFA